MKNSFSELYKKDLNRYGNSWKDNRWFHFLFRKAQTCDSRLMKGLFRWGYFCYCKKRGITLSWRTQVGEGLYLGHPFGITVNSNAVLGCNVNLHKGSTIGEENRGIRKGSPIIGNDVWVGINATIVGRITIGNDVLIAPLAYVNFDVPDHSIVIGNPGRIIHSDEATSYYINNKV